MELFNQFVVIMGGTSVVLAALFGLIGKLWLSVVIEKYKGSINKELSKLKVELDKSSKRYEAQLSKITYVSQVQFDHEYQIYSKVWSSLVELKVATEKLRPFMDYIDPNQTEDARKFERLKAFAKPYSEFSIMLETHKPFYAETVYEALKEVKAKCHHESVDFEVGRRHEPGYYQDAIQNSEQISSAIDKACNQIRSRLQEVTVI
ncbi:hypothetical protein KIT90_25585 [Vibrio sp. B172a]|nr:MULTISPECIES: hypothetical protein [Vibrio]ELA9846703.1 hypothetical protein [Vibrio parahaemolyticus]MBE3977005.1 hypothetical protein [Vibrio parahaemolyticus]MDK9784763.1 hypothetical protein [Vibrio sp. B172a]ODX79923.1 hypothetical protein BBM12_07785 [Vibrio parahaemolyticus]ODX90236.1 hypothetical protein BBM93_06265 [Vibrio parahaemolyticus]